MTEAIEIAVAAAVNPELMEALTRLVPQLTPGATIPSSDDVREIIESPSTTLLVARDQSAGGRIIGALTLIVFRVGTGLRALIEDVVVDTDARGRGVTATEHEVRCPLER